MDTYNLLPPGFYDVLPPDSHHIHTITSTILERFYFYGYESVTPPLIEYEPNLTQSTKRSAETPIFKAQLPQHDQILAVRADFTPQIARIARSRLAHKPKPLRLSYAGDVVRQRPTTPKRQWLQAGIELIGTAAYYANIEILHIALDCIATLKLPLDDIVCDITLPPLLETLFTHFDTSPEDQAQLNAYVQQKSFDQLQSHPSTSAAFIYKLSTLPPNDWAVLCNHINGLGNAYCTELVQQIQHLAGTISTYFPQLRITFDCLDASNHTYYTGPCFTLFSASTKRELAHGGRYMIQCSDSESLAAVGCTLHIHALAHLLPLADMSHQRIYVPQEYATPQRIAQLHKQGFITITGFQDNATKEAAELGIDTIFNPEVYDD